MRSLKLIRWLAAAVAVEFLLATGMAGVGSVSPSPQGESLQLQLASSGGGAGDSGNGKNNGTGNDKKTILVSGSVTNLFPGAVKPLPLTLRNRNNFAVVVTTIQTTITDAALACPASNIRVEDFVGRKRVGANSSAVQNVTVRMRNDAPNACKSVAWFLTFSGRAEKP